MSYFAFWFQMKKRISKNIFHFSILIIELKNKKRKYNFFESVLIKKPISKNENQKFRIQISIWNQKMNFKKFFHFPILVMKLENEKWKIFKIRFLFLNQKTNYTFDTRIVFLYLNFVFRIEVKTKSW